ncbi:interferon gamma receptor 2 [Xyrauchen texanus]|uniref:interferon gamma receptor 2 n=1 Tax=Xyrauchen texanus TaxID=154827 RepID=UPI00224253AA|nr:interferon gamma receptor 2 [Xyrauchen texanus]
MIRHIYAVALFILMVDLAKTVDLQRPDVRTVGSELQWKSANDESVLYSVQYKLGSKPAEEWHNMSSHIGTKLKTLNITAEFYGAVFRVCAEKGNQTSEWQNSKPVKCLNIQYCVPLIHLTVKPGMAHLYMEHMDQSLVDEFGNGIAFNISYWKVANGDHSEVQFYITNGNSQLFPNLESGLEYCFQVQYLWYNKPYGNTSLQRCAIIPETAEEKKRRDLLLSILATVFVSAVCVCFIFAFFKNHKKLKQLFRPSPEIPDHYREFLTGEYFQQLYRCPSSQSLQSCDIITLIENNKMEPNGQEEEQARRS